MYIFFAILALGILILVHEFGHFIVAKFCGVYVERFSIGFGPILLKRRYGETEYCLSAVPLGGYVKLHRMFKEEPVIEGKEEQAFYNKPYYKKMLIIVAGVVFNMLFAVILLSVAFSLGYKTYAPVVYSVEEGSAGYSAGFTGGDRILSVGGKSIRSWDEFETALDEKTAYPVQIVVDRNGAKATLQFTPTFTDVTVNGVSARVPVTGLKLDIPSVVGGVMTGFPAEKAGMAEGDRIIAINGQPVYQWAEVTQIMQQYSEGEIPVTVMRGGEELSLNITPVKQDGRTLLGISAPQGDIVVRSNPIEATALGIESSINVTKAIYVGIYQLITGKVKKENLGGPILIIQEGSKSAKSGITQYLFYIALISINLGVLNLLPIPVLDGGHAVMYTYERVSRRQISMKARESGQMVGMMLLGLLMVFAFYNDIMRFFK